MSTLPTHAPLDRRSPAAEPPRALFVATACILLGFGVLMVHSASITSWPTEFERVYLSRHLVFLVLGVAAAAVSAALPSRFWLRAAPWLFVLTVLLLVLVLVPGVGARINGAQRWFRFGRVSCQPSELAKIALPLLLARNLTCGGERRRGLFASTVPVLAPIALAVPLVAVEPDLGTSLFLVAGAGIALFVGGWPLRNFIVSAILIVPAAGAFLSMKSYQLKRIEGFLAAWSDWTTAPYQLRQSLMSLGSGGLLGTGLGRGWQKLSFLPEANTDFVFAVVGEELGLVGTLGLVATWIALYVAGLRLIRDLPRGGFAYVAAFTLLTQLVLQAAVNVAVVTAMVPPKGIPHPLISYGGSNLLASLVSLGIVIGLARGDSVAAEET